MVMAVSSSFKQKCPSCEAMVSIKDPSLVGKKVECSKCKYKFLVESPVDQDKAAVKKRKEEEENGTNGKNGNGAKSKVKAGAAAAGKEGSKKRFTDEDLEDRDEKPAKSKRMRDDDEDEGPSRKARGDDDDDEKAPAGAPKKLILGLGLAIFGFAVFAIAIYLFFLSGPSGNTGPVNPGPNTGGPKGPQIVDNNDAKGDEKKTPEVKQPEQKVATREFGPEQTNLFPNDTEHLFHAFMKEVFSSSTGLRDAVFNEPGSLAGVNFKQRLGFDVQDIADLIRGEKYSAPSWSMTVLFFKEPVNEADIIAKLNLKKVEPTIKNYTYYKATQPNATFEHLARVSFGVPQKLRVATMRSDRPLYVYFYDAQTVVAADEVPLTQLLNHDRHFTELTPRPEPPKAPANNQGGFPGSGFPGPGSGLPGGGIPPPNPGGGTGLPPPGGAGTGVGGSGSGSVPPPGPKQGAGLDLPGNADRAGFYNMPGMAGPSFFRQSGQAGSNQPPSGQAGSNPPSGQAGSNPPGGAPPGGILGAPGSSGFGPGGQGGNVPPGGMIPPPGGMPPPGGAPPGGGPPPLPKVNPKDEMYLTVKPELKKLLDRLEQRPDGSKERVLFSSVTDLQAATVNMSDRPEFNNQVVRIPRELWDVTYLLEERRPNLNILGTVLIRKESRTFQLRNELLCDHEASAKDHYKHLVEMGAPQLARLFEKLLDHKLQLPKADAPPPPANNGPGGPGFGGGLGPPGLGGPGGAGLGSGAGAGGGLAPPGLPGGAGGPGGGQAGNEKKSDEPAGSQITVTRKDKQLDFTVELVMDKLTFERVLNIATFTAGAIRYEIDLANRKLQNALARAAKEAGEKGLSLSDLQVQPGRWPPAAFPAGRTAQTRQAQDPQNRISLMAGLLPFLGKEPLFSRIDLNKNWRDPANWMVGKALVPEFLDPNYPDASRQVVIAGVPVEFGATHFVGIAGVGLDAPLYPRDDPAYIAKRGVFGYDKSASMDDVRNGRGLSNTITMIQVPHDGPAGVTPWIAGGGSTVRGVPEKNSIAPFVLTTDKHGKVITNEKGKRGTYAMMADGSVRFIDQNISDDVFKAMCTVGGPAPEGFNLTTNPHTPLKEFKNDDMVPDAPVIRPELKTGAPKDKEDAQASDAALPKGWVRFRGEGYTVALPHEPKSMKQPVGNGMEMNMNFAMLLDKKLVFICTSIQIPAGELAKQSEDEMFKQIAMGMAAKGGRIQKEAPITLGKYKGREYVVDMPLPPQAGGGNQIGIVRLYLADGRAVMLMMMGSDGAMPREGTTFFESLKIGN
jgi:hypothetical protein